jgi:hypothetical protein
MTNAEYVFGKFLGVLALFFIFNIAVRGGAGVQRFLCGLRLWDPHTSCIRSS